MEPKLSVIVCTSGRPKSLKRCWQSLERQSFKNFETLVIREKGLAKARDLGWRRAKGELVAWIDDDVVVDKDWAKNLVKIFDDNPDVGGVSGPTIVPEKLLKNRLAFWWYGRDDFWARLWVKGMLQKRPFDVGRIYSHGWWSPGSNFKSCLKLKGLWEVDYLEACNMSLRRSLVEKVGGFDLGYKGTSEWCEVDLAMRVKQLGYRLVFSSQVKVEHHVSKSGVFSERRNIIERLRNFVRFYQRRWLFNRRGSSTTIVHSDPGVAVSVVVANHRADELFQRTIKSLINSVTAPERNKMEVIVVNNGLGAEKADEVRKWLSHFAKASRDKPVKLLQIQEGNPSKARNFGARAARGKYLLFLDNDVEVEKGWLDEMVKYLDKQPKVGAGQLKLLRMGTNKFDSAGELLTGNGFLAERAREAKDEGQFDQADLIFSGKGAALAVRREVFFKSGGFDEDYEYYWEEPDLFWRVWKAGYEVRFLWMAKVRHAYGTRKKPVAKVPAEQLVYLSCRNQIMTILKNGVGFRRWRMFFGVSLSWLGLEILFLLRGKLKQAWAIERAWWWIIFHFGTVMRKRRRVKRHLPSDDQWMEQVTIKKRLGWHLGKGLAYIAGRGF